MGSGNTARCMAREFTSGAMGDILRGIMCRGRNKDKESLFGLMEESTKVHGETENKMERAPSSIKVEKSKKDSGN